MGTIRKTAHGRALRALTTTLVLTLLAALLLAGTALAAAKPGQPTAKVPKGTIKTIKPTFKWSEAARAVKYELRVYQGSTQKLKKTGLTKLSYKAVKALPTNVTLTWKVRASNAAGAGAWSRSIKFKIVPPSSAKAITSLGLVGPTEVTTGVINETLHTIAVTMPFETDVSALVATFATSGAAVAIAGTAQVSGVTVNNFINPVTYTVTAADATTQEYVVTVTVALNPAKAITAFSIRSVSSAASGVIDQGNHTIAVTVPYGTNVTTLVATFLTTGASVKVGSTTQVSGTTPNNFTSAVTYKVTAADATTQDYVVTVTVAKNPAKAITAFGFSSPTIAGVIDEAHHAIAVNVPFGVYKITGLRAIFTTTGASVKVGSTTQTSGVTANDFTSPVTYKVTAADATTQDYVVTVKVAAAVIGQGFGGGKIAYILQPGDPGYSATVPHGLIARSSDQSTDTGIIWAKTAYQGVSVSGTGTAIGSGSANTDKIIAQNGTGTTYAAGLARVTSGTSDWYLPSKDELSKLYLNRVAIGGFAVAWYWSSSQNNSTTAWVQSFTDGYWFTPSKFIRYRVRAVRSF